MSLAIRQANMVIIIFCLTSTMSSGRAYTLAPAFLAMEIAYLALDILSCNQTTTPSVILRLSSNEFGQRPHFTRLRHLLVNKLQYAGNYCAKKRLKTTLDSLMFVNKIHIT